MSNTVQENTQTNPTESLAKNSINQQMRTNTSHSSYIGATGFIGSSLANRIESRNHDLAESRSKLLKRTTDLSLAGANLAKSQTIRPNWANSIENSPGARPNVTKRAADLSVARSSSAILSPLNSNLSPRTAINVNYSSINSGSHKFQLTNGATYVLQQDMIITSYGQFRGFEYSTINANPAILDGNGFSITIMDYLDVSSANLFGNQSTIIIKNLTIIPIRSTYSNTDDREFDNILNTYPNNIHCSISYIQKQLPVKYITTKDISGGSIELNNDTNYVLAHDLFDKSLATFTFTFSNPSGITLDGNGFSVLFVSNIFGDNSCYVAITNINMLYEFTGSLTGLTALNLNSTDMRCKSIAYNTITNNYQAIDITNADIMFLLTSSDITLTYPIDFTSIVSTNKYNVIINGLGNNMSIVDQLFVQYDNINVQIQNLVLTFDSNTVMSSRDNWYGRATYKDTMTPSFPLNPNVYISMADVDVTYIIHLSANTNYYLSDNLIQGNKFSGFDISGSKYNHVALYGNGYHIEINDSSLLPIKSTNNNNALTDVYEPIHVFDLPLFINDTSDYVKGDLYDNIIMFNKQIVCPVITTNSQSLTGLSFLTLNSLEYDTTYTINDVVANPQINIESKPAFLSDTFNNFPIIIDGQGVIINYSGTGSFIDIDNVILKNINFVIENSNSSPLFGGKNCIAMNCHIDFQNGNLSGSALFPAFSGTSGGNYAIATDCSIKVNSIKSSTVASGGIMGFASGAYGGYTTVNNCAVTCAYIEDTADSTGNIKNKNSGGIMSSMAGAYGGFAAANNCTAVMQYCKNGSHADSSAAGGIMGGSAGSYGGFAIANNCKLSCMVLGVGCGGILGARAGSNGGTAIANNCTSETVSISSGGIMGAMAGHSYGNATAINCSVNTIFTYIANVDIPNLLTDISGMFLYYDTESESNIYLDITSSAGGIMGSYAGAYYGIAKATNCKVKASLSSDGIIDVGGIMGKYSGLYCGTAMAKNCSVTMNEISYNSGGIMSEGAGGLYDETVNRGGTVVVSNCKVITDNIYNYSGGILGKNTGCDLFTNSSITIDDCVVNVIDINNVSSGIIGSSSGGGNGSVFIRNCNVNVSGSIKNTSGGILGSLTDYLDNSLISVTKCSVFIGSDIDSGGGGIVGGQSSAVVSMLPTLSSLHIYDCKVDINGHIRNSETETESRYGSGGIMGGFRNNSISLKCARCIVMIVGDIKNESKNGGAGGIAGSNLHTIDSEIKDCIVQISGAIINSNNGKSSSIGGIVAYSADASAINCTVTVSAITGCGCYGIGYNSESCKVVISGNINKTTNVKNPNYALSFNSDQGQGRASIFGTADPKFVLNQSGNHYCHIFSDFNMPLHS